MTAHDDTRTSEELGLDFATWLLWKSVSGAGKVELTSALSFELYVLGPLTLVSDYGEATSITLQGDNPAGSPEAARALNEGKHLAKFVAKLIHQNQSHDFTFNALTFTCASLKLPPIEKGPPIDTLMIRLDAFERFEEFWSEIYGHFLEIRLAEKPWKAETGKIRKWVQGLKANLADREAVGVGHGA